MFEAIPEVQLALFRCPSTLFPILGPSEVFEKSCILSFRALDVELCTKATAGVKREDTARLRKHIFSSCSQNLHLKGETLLQSCFTVSCWIYQWICVLCVDTDTHREIHTHWLLIHMHWQLIKILVCVFMALLLLHLFAPLFVMALMMIAWHECRMLCCAVLWSIEWTNMCICVLYCRIN